MNRPAGPARRCIAVIGGGWAGLAAAVHAVQRGAQVTLLEMAQQPGGRARGVDTSAGCFDNGQHILIGAYSATLALMRQVGADPDRLLLRRPLALAYPDGRGLSLPAGAPIPAFARAVLAARHWRWAERLTLLRTTSRWLWQGFRCPPTLSVAQLCARLPVAVQHDLIEPLCVAALNTPMHAASGQVFLRVLRDALFAGRGSADLLLPRASLSALLPEPAWSWLIAQGADCRTGHRVQILESQAGTWRVDGQPFGAVVLASTATEAARLTASCHPAWSAAAASLRYQPIVTAYLHDAALRLPKPMLALPAGPQAPAQFVFDLEAIGAQLAGPGVFAFVVSGAASWLEDSLATCAQAVLRQARSSFDGAFRGPDAAVLLHIAAERRATFACTPGLNRPAPQIAPGLMAAGDYVQGPYPATLEGAVRSGLAAAAALA